MSQQMNFSTNLKLFMGNVGAKRIEDSTIPTISLTSSNTFNIRRSTSKRTIDIEEIIPTKRKMTMGDSANKTNLQDFVSRIGSRLVQDLRNDVRHENVNDDLKNKSNMSYVQNLNIFMNFINVHRINSTQVIDEMAAKKIVIHSKKENLKFSTSAELVISRNKDLHQFVPKIKNFLRRNAIEINEKKIMQDLCFSFDCQKKQATNCIENFAKKTKMSVEKVKELMVELDPAGSSSAVTSHIASLSKEMRKWKFYVGATNSFEERKRSHNKIHLTLLGQPILKIDSFAMAAFAETAAICTLQKLVSQKKICGSWNKSFGYDSPTLINASMTSKETTIYMIYSPRPFEKPKSVQGSLKMKSTKDEREVGKFFSIQTNQSVSHQNLDRHMDVISRENFECNKCNSIFASKTVREKDIFNYHTDIKTKCECVECGYKSSYSSVVKHIQEIHHFEV